MAEIRKKNIQDIYRYMMYKHYTKTDSQRSQLCNRCFSQDTLHSLPIFTVSSRGASLVSSQCIARYRRARAVYFIWESDAFNSLKPREAYIGEVNYAFLGSDNDLSPVRNRATVWSNAELLSIPNRSHFDTGGYTVVLCWRK